MNRESFIEESDEAHLHPYEVASDDASEERINEVIDGFINGEGGESLMNEAARNARERVLRKQVASGSLKLIFDPGSETTTLMSSQSWRELQKKMNRR